MPGKVPSLDQFMAFSPPLMGAEEINEVADTLKSGWLTTGPKTERFEKELATNLGSGRGVAVNSCTSALHLALATLGVGPGQGVITTPLTFASTAHVIMYQQARPYFVDIEPSTGNLDPQKVRRFLAEECEVTSQGRPRCRATGEVITTLLPVHYGGHPVDLAAFWGIAQDYNLNMVEDAAHAIGSVYQGLPIGHRSLKPASAGALESLVAFSFYATKNITTGEGGYLSAGRDDLIEKARILSMYGISDSRRIWGRYAPKGTWVYDVAQLGFKYNMMDIQAALGLHQLAKLPDFMARRAVNAAIYNEALAGLEELVVLPKVKEGVVNSWHLYPLRLRPGALTMERDGFIELLRQHNLGSSVLFIPLHYHSYYKEALSYHQGDFPEAEKYFENLINLPIAPAHSPDLVAKAAEIIVGLLKKHKR